MGIAPDVAAARARSSTPSLGIVASPGVWLSQAGGEAQASAADLSVRVISGNHVHPALPLTAAVCVAVAAALPDSLVHIVARQPEGPLRLGLPSGVLNVAAEVRKDADGWYAQCGSYYRTARRLFEGRVCLPA
jgi:2-methylaconitate cis-trans-isomerase PrpF